LLSLVFLLSFVAPVTDNSEPTPRVVAVVGPTGSGKTALALALARALGGEIVNADSRQVYRGLDIGSAKPSPAERAALPHHLFDIVAPDAVFDCAQYRSLAVQALTGIAARGRVAVLVGGTGLYLRALRHGLFPGPPRDPALRQRLAAAEAAAPGELHRRLAAVDTAAAARLHPHDLVRLTRALEVFALTGRPLSEWQDTHRFAAEAVPMALIGADLPRELLYTRLDRRCAEMLEGGLIAEVEGLWRAGYGPELPALRSIGYREVGRYLRGLCTLEEARDDMARATRRYAKRQLTWFRADPSVHWLDAREGAAARALALLCDLRT
jgi:tRNA dimethylallyltransferase